MHTLCKVLTKDARRNRPNLRVLVAGGGPAGLAIAAATARVGFSTRLISPDLDEPWPNSYGAFEHSAAPLGLGSAVRARFTTPLVYAKSGATKLEEPYLRFDSKRLKSLLTSRAEIEGVSFERGSVSLKDRGTDEIIIDATGPGARLSRNSAPGAPGYQSAYGLWIRVEKQPFGPEQMVLMDYRDPGHGKFPSFLYALAEGEDRLFVQETVLVHPRPIDMGELRETLLARLAQLGIRPAEILGEERCVIPMGAEIPVSLERPGILPFGAAAGLVHPATGYQLTRALGLCDTIACVLRENAERGPTEAAEAAYSALWPYEERVAWELYRQGAGVISEFNRASMQSFVSSFFSLQSEHWLGFMEGKLTHLKILDAMWRVFKRADSRLRLGLIFGGSRRGCRALSHVWSIPQAPNKADLRRSTT